MGANPNDPLFDDPQDTGGQAPSGEDTSTMKAVRDAARREERGRKAAERRVEELTSQVEKLSEIQVRQAFQSAGLSEKIADLYVKANPDIDPLAITSDAVKEFATEYGIPTEPAPAGTDQGDAQAQAVAQADLTKQAQERLQSIQQQAAAGAGEIGAEAQTTPVAPPFRPGTGSPAEPEQVTSREVFQAAQKGDWPTVQRLVAEEAARPGRIKFAHPEALE